LNVCFKSRRRVYPVQEPASRLTYVVLGDSKCSLYYKDISTLACKFRGSLGLNEKHGLVIEKNFKSDVSTHMNRWRREQVFVTEALSIIDSMIEKSENKVNLYIQFNAEVMESPAGQLICGENTFKGEAESGQWKGKRNVLVYSFSKVFSGDKGQVCKFSIAGDLKVRGTSKKQKVLKTLAISNISRTLKSYTKGDFAIKTIYCGNQYNKIEPYQDKSVVNIVCKGGTSLLIGIIANASPNVNAIQTVPRLKFTAKTVTNGHRGSQDLVWLQSDDLVSSVPMIQVSLGKDLFPEEFGGLELDIEVVPKPPKLKGEKSVGVIEKDLNWYLPLETINVTELKAKIQNIKKADDLGTFLSGSGNPHYMDEFLFSTNAPLDIPWSFPFDLKSELSKRDPDFENGFLRVSLGSPVFRKGASEGAERLKAQGKSYYNYYQSNFNLQFNTLLVTNIGLHIKKGSYNTLVYAFNIKTGKPLEDVEVKAWADGKSIVEGETDEDGFFEFGTMKEPSTKDWKVVTAELDDDYSFLLQTKDWSKGIRRYDFGYADYYNSSPDTSELVDVVAERPLYKPGQKVLLKVFARKFENDHLKLQNPTKKQSIVVRNPQSEIVFKGDIQFNDYGTALADFDLKSDAKTGWYEATIGKITVEKAFQVEEFRKPQFKIVLDPVTAGKEREYSFKGRAEYHFGGGVKEAPGNAIVLFKSTDFKPTNETWKKYRFGRNSYHYSYYNDSSSVSTLSRESLETGSKGYFSHKFNINPSSDYGLLTFEANFQDENGGTIANRISETYSRHDYFIGMKLDRWSYKTGTKIEPKFAVIDRGEKPAFGKKVNVEVVREYYETTRRLGTGNYYYYDWNRKTESAEGCSFNYKKLDSTCSIDLKKHGTYRFIVTLDDGSSASTHYSTYVYGGDSYYGYRPYNHDRIDLHVSSQKVKKGDTLEVLLMSPFKEAEGFITIERDGILHKEKVKIKGNTFQHKIKIDKDWMVPGFYVSAVIFRGRTKDKVEGNVDLGKPAFKIGYAKVEVEHSLKALQTRVSTSKSEYRPGEELEIEIETLDTDKRARRSELAVAVVDEALLQLSTKARKNYDILDSFYKLGSLKVDNYETLVQLIGQRTYGKKGGTPGGGGGKNNSIRDNFKSVAYWNPRVEIDGRGRLKLKAKLPDNLTGWRVIVVAVDKEHRFGYGEKSFKVNKKLMIKKALPNFLVSGDELDAKFTVHNRYKSSLDVSLSLSTEGLSSNEKVKKAKIKSDDSESFLFKTVAQGAGVSSFVLKASGGDYFDGVKYLLDVIPKKSKVFRFGDSGIIKDKEVTTPFSLPKSAIGQKVQIHYSNNALEGLDEVFKYVLSYPYGCWEQRLTKSFFLAKYKKLEDRLLYYRFPEKEKSVEVAIQELLDMGSQYQTKNGGFRYYPGGSDEPVEHLSIFTGFAFDFMLENGFQVDPVVLGKLKSYLKKALKGEVSSRYGWSRLEGFSRKAYLIYVLGELEVKGLDAEVTEVYSNRKQLDLFAASFFMTYLSKKPKYSSQFEVMKQRILNKMDKSSNEVSFGEFYEKKESYWKRYWYTSMRSQCTVLANLVESKVKMDDIYLFVRSILKGRVNGRYYNTQENIYCFDALEKFANVYEAGAKEVVVSTSLNKAPFKKSKVSMTGGKELVSMSDKDILPGKSYTIGMSQDGKAPVFYHTLLEYQEKDARQDTAIEEGFRIKKSLYLWTKDKSWKKLKGKDIKLKRGDLVKVRLDVTSPSDRFTVGLNDPLAGCFEPVNTRLATASQGALALKTPVKKKERFDWSTYFYRSRGFEYMDLRLKSAQFFSKKLKGNTSYYAEYLTQVIATGKFHMNAPVVEEMYYPEVMGVGVDRTITVTE
jgi:uncharacterized protein YfaS (alpha-2-macroglobulin family)